MSENYGYGPPEPPVYEAPQQLPPISEPALEAQAAPQLPQLPTLPQLPDLGEAIVTTTVGLYPALIPAAAKQQPTAVACLEPNSVVDSTQFPEELQRSKPLAKSTDINKDGTITVDMPAIGQSVTVQPVKVDLGPNPKETLDRVLKEKTEADKGPQEPQVKEYNATFGKDCHSPTDVSKDMKYYGSDRHRAYGEIASARTGGQIPPEWFMQADPFGGFSGGFPGDIKRKAIEAGVSALPEAEQKTARDWMASPSGKDFMKSTWELNQTNDFPLGNTGIAHDTDMLLKWFGAGTLAPLKGEPFWFNGVGAVPGDPKDDDEGKRIRANFAKAGMPQIPDYLMTDGNAPGWSFEPHDLLTACLPPALRVADHMKRLATEGYGGFVKAMAASKALESANGIIQDFGNGLSGSNIIPLGL
jgi:hypothetical protein